MACFGFIRRILIDPATGQALDVGRAHRRFTPRQNRALAVRDGGCMFPGCDRGVRWTEAHHLHHWEHHGPTNLDNGLLLCRRHHTLIHTKAGRSNATPPPARSPPPAPTARQFHRKPTPHP